jgi:hypothetical protein
MGAMARFGYKLLLQDIANAQVFDFDVVIHTILQRHTH